MQHSPWRDESQSWLTSIHPKTIQEFFGAIRYERHPPLFYILIRGFKYFYDLFGLHSFPQWRIPTIISAGATTASLYFLLFKIKDASKFLIFLIFLSYYLIFEYTVIARNYSLGFFPLIASIYYYQNKSNKKELFWLLFSCGVHLFYTIGVGPYLIYRIVKTKFYKKFLWHTLFILIFLILLLLLQIPPSDSGFSTGIRFHHSNFLKIALIFASSFTSDETYVLNTSPNFGVALIAVSFFLSTFYVLAKKDALIEFWILSFFPLIIMVAGFNPSLRHVGVLYLYMIFIVVKYSKKLEKRINVMFVYSFFMLIHSVNFLNDWKPWRSPPSKDFTGIKELMAEYGNLLNSNQTVLMSSSQFHLYPVMSATNKIGFEITQGDWIYYPKILNTSDATKRSDVWCSKNREKLTELFPDKCIVWVELESKAPPEECFPFKKIFEQKRKTITDERYVAYIPESSSDAILKKCLSIQKNVKFY